MRTQHHRHGRAVIGKNCAEIWKGDEMNNLTRKQLRGLFIAIEVNLLLWLSVCGALLHSVSVDHSVKYFAIAGMIVAALLQH